MFISNLSIIIKLLILTKVIEFIYKAIRKRTSKSAGESKFAKNVDNFFKVLEDLSKEEKQKKEDIIIKSEKKKPVFNDVENISKKQKQRERLINQINKIEEKRQFEEVLKREDIVISDDRGVDVFNLTDDSLVNAIISTEILSSPKSLR